MSSDRVIIHLNIVFTTSDFSDAHYIRLRDKVFYLMLQKALPAAEATPVWGHVTLANNSSASTTAFARIKADDLSFEESIQPGNWLFNLHDFYSEHGRSEDIRIRVKCSNLGTVGGYYSPAVEVRLPSIPLATFKSRLSIFEDVSREIFGVFHGGRGNLYTTPYDYEPGNRDRTVWVELR